MFLLLTIRRIDSCPQLIYFDRCLNMLYGDCPVITKIKKQLLFFKIGLIFV